MKYPLNPITYGGGGVLLYPGFRYCQLYLSLSQWFLTLSDSQIGEVWLTNDLRNSTQLRRKF